MTGEGFYFPTFACSCDGNGVLTGSSSTRNACSNRLGGDDFFFFYTVVQVVHAGTKRIGGNAWLTNTM